MKLNRDKPRMIFQLDNFHQIPFGVNARKLHIGAFKLIAVQVVKFIPVPMAFPNFVHFIGPLRFGLLCHHTAERAKPERTTKLHILLVGH